MKYFRLLIDDGEKIQVLSFKKTEYICDALKSALDSTPLVVAGDSIEDFNNFAELFLRKYCSNFLKERQSDSFFLSRQEAYEYLTDFLNTAHKYVINPDDLKSWVDILAFDYLRALQINVDE